MEITPKDLSTRELHGLLLSTVVPRPIAFASTVDDLGNVNLSPFSYFNVFSTNPPTLIFSPSRRGRDNTTKDSYENVLKVPEAVINIVTYDIAEQMSLSSSEYSSDVDEYIKSGLTPIPSLRVKPPRVKESPVAFECKVNKVDQLGTGPGAGNLVICEILLIHVNDEILFENSFNADPDKLKAIGRMGKSSYIKAYGESIFDIQRGSHAGIGFDLIPEEVRTSKFLTGADLARLAGIDNLPGSSDIQEFIESEEFKGLGLDAKDMQSKHLTARKFIHSNDILTAWKILLAG